MYSTALTGWLVRSQKLMIPVVTAEGLSGGSGEICIQQSPVREAGQNFIISAERTFRVTPTVIGYG